MPSQPSQLPVVQHIPMPPVQLTPSYHPLMSDVEGTHRSETPPTHIVEYGTVWYASCEYGTICCTSYETYYASYEYGTVCCTFYGAYDASHEYGAACCTPYGTYYASCGYGTICCTSYRHHAASYAAPVIFQSLTRSSSTSHGSPRSQHQQTPPAPQPPFIINTTEGQ